MTTQSLGSTFLPSAAQITHVECNDACIQICMNCYAKTGVVLVQFDMFRSCIVHVVTTDFHAVHKGRHHALASLQNGRQSNVCM